jgi:hypothetical protein
MRPIVSLCLVAAVLVSGAALLRSRSDGAAEAGVEALKVTHTRNASTIPLHDVFELTFTHDRVYANPFFDVTIDVTFRSPSGKSAAVGGFHYGSSRPPKIEVVKDSQGSSSWFYVLDNLDLCLCMLYAG